MQDIFLTVITIIISMIMAWFTASYAIRKNYKEGKIQLFEIIIRYFILLINLFDKKTSKISEDNVSKRLYSSGISIIEKDLRALITNPYFNKLIEKNPKISKLLVLLQRNNIIAQDILKEPKYRLDFGIYNMFSEIFDALKKELPKKYLTKDPIYKEVLELKKSLDKQMKNDFTSDNNE